MQKYTFVFKSGSIQKDNVLGSGMFGKCYHGSVGPVAACVKVSKVKIFDYSFIREANMLSSCCHPNVSYLLAHNYVLQCL